MNKIMEVISLLGFEPYEEFKIDNYPNIKFRFTDSELQSIGFGEWGKCNPMILGQLIYGTKLIRLPYRPNNGDTYWTLTGPDFDATCTMWDDCAIDYCRLRLGMVFRTKEGLLAKRDEIYQMLTGNGLEV